MRALRVGSASALALLGALAALAVTRSALAADPAVLFHFHDHRIDEASGAGRGLASPGVFYVQNDSGDAARFFAVDASTGVTRAVYRVPGAVNHDWEDLAVAPDAAGTSSVWLADTGDNDAVREQVQLYRVDEPHVDMSRKNAVASTGTPDVWRLRYPAGPTDAEALAVAPGGRAYLITKAADGRSAVYRVPLHPDARHVQLLQRIGSITFDSHGGLVPASLQVLATGAALSPDGTQLAVRTYTDAYLWPVRRGDVAAAIRQRPTRIAIPLQPQGEGVCFSAGSLVLDSEGRGSAVYGVPLPTQPGPSTASTRPPVTPSAPPSATGSATDSPDALPYIIAAAIVVALGFAVSVWRRRGRE